MKSIRIFIACSVGAFVGSMIALQMYQMFWWIGAVIGAFVAYLGYDIEEVITAVSVAYRRTINWRPNHEFWSIWCDLFISPFNLTVNTGVGCGLIGALGYLFWGVHTPVNNWSTIRLEGIAFLVSIGLGLVMGLVIASSTATEWLQRGTDLYNCLTCPNVFRFYFCVLPRYIVICMWWFIVHSPNGTRKAVKLISVATKLIKTFAVEFFCLIHSELRLLCAIDAALGTAVGYFIGNSLIGGIVGGVLGVVNYEIITVRVMKLVGTKSLFK